MRSTIKTVAQNAVAITEALIGNDQASDIYEIMKDQVGGFPGVQMLYVGAAEIFTQVEPDKGETFDWIAAIDRYAADLFAHTQDQGDWPHWRIQAAYANKAIKAETYDNGTRDIIVPNA